MIIETKYYLHFFNILKILGARQVLALWSFATCAAQETQESARQIPAF